MTACLACAAPSMHTILDFGPQPAANLLCATPGETVRREVLALDYCHECGHAQQHHFYPSEELFSHYLYQSGTSNTLKQFFDRLAEVIAHQHGPSGRILEIASNDGSFLAALAARKLNAEGVEPAANLAALANEAGLKTTHAFWPSAEVQGVFDAVVAMNVVAHTPDPCAFLQGVKRVLAPDGIAYIQVSQIDMFKHFEFDTLYHEHYSFFAPNSMKRLSERAGFAHARAVKTDIHGGSMMALLGDNEAALERAAAALCAFPYALGALAMEDRPAVADAEHFSQRASQTCDTVCEAARLAQKAGYKVVLVGAAAKAITVLQASHLAPDVVVDEAPLKIGLYVPGTNYKIEPLSAVEALHEPVLFIIGAWNFRQELSSKLRRLRHQPGDLVSVYFPRFILQPLC